MYCLQLATSFPACEYEHVKHYLSYMFLSDTKDELHTNVNVSIINTTRPYPRLHKFTDAFVYSFFLFQVPCDGDNLHINYHLIPVRDIFCFCDCCSHHLCISCLPVMHYSFS